MSDISHTTPAPPTSTPRRRGPAARRHIQVPDDELVPRDELSAEVGVSPRSGQRMFRRVVYVGGIAYVPRIASLRDLAGQVRQPEASRSQRAPRRGRRQVPTT